MNRKNILKSYYPHLLKWKSGKHFPLLKFAGIAVATLIIFTAYSYRPNPISIGKKEIKQSGIKDYFSSVTYGIGMLAIKRSDTSYQKAAIDSSKQRFLLIGDSMLETLSYRLNDYCKKNNHTMNAVIWYSSSTLWYGNSDTVAYFIKKFDPTYVILVLGANELFVKNINTRDKLVKHIIQQIGDIKYIWVGPPNWKEDTGINNLIYRNVGKKKYFASKKLTYERFKDGAHPTKKSGYKWMDSVATYIMNESMYPVLLEFPDAPALQKPSLTLLGPHPPKGL